MSDFKFGTAINCIDGRTQEPVIAHMKRKYNIDGVDMVTFPGADGVLSNDAQPGEIVAQIQKSVSISIEKHGSRVIAVVGHYDCAGNPGDKEYHYMHIRQAIQKVSSWNFPAKVVGYYVNDRWEIEDVSTSTAT